MESLTNFPRTCFKLQPFVCSCGVLLCNSDNRWGCHFHWCFSSDQFLCHRTYTFWVWKSTNFHFIEARIRAWNRARTCRLIMNFLSVLLTVTVAIFRCCFDPSINQSDDDNISLVSGLSFTAPAQLTATKDYVSGYHLLKFYSFCIRKATDALVLRRYACFNQDTFLVTQNTSATSLLTLQKKASIIRINAFPSLH